MNKHDTRKWGMLAWLRFQVLVTYGSPVLGHHLLDSNKPKVGCLMSSSYLGYTWVLAIPSTYYQKAQF